MQHPDRVLPAEPGVREIARRIYTGVRGLPLVSPHSHVDASVLAHDEPFADPAQLLVTSDHYVTRLLHAHGVDLADVGVGASSTDEARSRRVWRILCQHWSVYRGTPVRYWLEAALIDVFGVSQQLSPDTADDVYDHIAACLTRPEFRPRALFQRFDLDVLATTDDPADNLEAHRALRDESTWHGRVIPTFRPDRYLEAGNRDWSAHVERLGAAADIDTTDYRGYVEALEARRRYFADLGATATDHSHSDLGSEPLSPREAARIYADALAGRATKSETTAFRRHMVSEMARMSCDDGLVMTLHPGVVRNHHGPTFTRFGPDTGHDIPAQLEVTHALRPLLERYGAHPNFHLVLFTVDETVYSRELAPLAGFYPSVYVGAPWWFLDSPDAMRRFREAVTDSAGYDKTAGFVDDTRAFCSIPVRHDLARRVDSGVLARHVAEHRLTEDEAVDIAIAITDVLPRKVFKL